jgi:hypothetical protein
VTDENLEKRKRERNIVKMFGKKIQKPEFVSTEFFSREKVPAIHEQNIRTKK